MVIIMVIVITMVLVTIIIITIIIMVMVVMRRVPTRRPHIRAGEALGATLAVQARARKADTPSLSPAASMRRRLQRVWTAV
jgi:ABC-type protease/lipase transport system fused ATPase/permease subunit